MQPLFFVKRGAFVNNLGEEIKDWIVSIVIAVVLAMIIRNFLVEPYLVDGPSMMPTLQNQQRLVVNRLIYRLREPEKGEILIFQYPKDPSRDFIKRVIAVPGDTIEIKDGNVFVNDELQTEDYNNSEDSRFPDVGFVPFELIKGKAMVVFWPLADMKALP